MPLKIWFKLILLSTSLTATLLAIFWLRQGHLSVFWTSLGLDSGSINWCEERVKSLYIFDLKAKIHEINRTWQWKQKNRNRTLDYLRVEKWFAGYCQVDANIVTTAHSQKSRVIFEVEFINGDHLVLREKGDYFEIRNKVFRSKTLRRGLKELLAFGPEIE